MLTFRADCYDFFFSLFSRGHRPETDSNSGTNRTVSKEVQCDVEILFTSKALDVPFFVESLFVCLIGCTQRRMSVHPRLNTAYLMIGIRAK
jgi:hypothetical protein